MDIWFIGMGGVGRAVIELWNLEKLYLDNKIYVIEPEALKQTAKWIFKNRKMKHIQDELTEKNADYLLKKVNNNSFVIDVSVNVSCNFILEILQKKQPLGYINTSIERWETFKDPDKKMPNKYKDFKEETLYYQEQLIKKDIKTNKHAFLINQGMNPGLVSQFTKMALTEVAKAKNIEFKSYAELAKQLELVTVNISEIDTQKTKFKFEDIERGNFINTWSPLGMQAEGVDHVLLTVGTLDKSFNKEKLIKPDEKDEKNTHICFIAKRGMDMLRKSWNCNARGQAKRYEGMLIPHAENISIGRLLSTKDYAPSVYYVYKPSDVCMRSLQEFRENKYKPLPNYYLLQLPDIKGGDKSYDSVGVLLIFKDNSKYFCGSVLSVKDVKGYGFKHSTPTVVQVATSLNSSMKYLLEHHDKGIISPEDLDYKIILDHAKKYLGTIVSKFI